MWSEIKHGYLAVESASWICWSLLRFDEESFQRHTLAVCFNAFDINEVWLDARLLFIISGVEWAMKTSDLAMVFSADIWHLVH